LRASKAATHVREQPFHARDRFGDVVRLEALDGGVPRQADRRAIAVLAWIIR